jgi:hypothetical protein
VRELETGKADLARRVAELEAAAAKKDRNSTDRSRQMQVRRGIRRRREEGE